MVSLFMSPHTSLPKALARVFVIIIAVDNLQKLGTKKVVTDYLTLMMTQSLFVSFVSFSSLSFTLSLSHPQEVKLCSLIVSLQNLSIYLSFYCPKGGSFFLLPQRRIFLQVFGKTAVVETTLLQETQKKLAKGCG